VSKDDGTDYVGLQSFVGGESQDIKFGQKYQYDYGRHIDVRKKPTQFSVLPKPTKASGTVVTDLVQDFTQVPSGIRYALGDSGNVYKIATNGTWTLLGVLGENGGAGIMYRADSDAVYITGQTKVARIKNVSTAETFEANWFAYGVSAATTCTKTGGAQTYTLTTSVTETAVNMRTFITDIEPLYRIGVKVVAKGTGNWTLTLHDDANNVLGTATVTNANLTNGVINYFTFSSPIRLLPSVNNFTSASSGGRTYHFHLTTSIAGGTAQTTTASTLADADMELWANALVQPTNGLHPIYQFAQLTLIGNEKYLTSYAPLQNDPTTSDFLRHQLTFPPGYEINGLAQLELYGAITAEKRSSSATRDFQEGKMFLWDGVSTTYNRYYDIPEGNPESVFSHKNTLYMIAGGALYQSSGGQPVKIRTFRNTDSEYSGVADSTHAYPHMMTVRKGILLIAYPSFTTNLSLEHAVYGYGQISRNFPMSWTTSYTISTGSLLNTGSNNLRIGAIRNFGDTLYISWRDGSSYGVDVVDNSSSPAADFTVQTLSFDNGEPYKNKYAKKALAVFEDLPDGVTLNMWYKIDDEASKHYLTDDGTNAITTGNCVTINIGKEFLRIQVGLDGTVGGTTSPKGHGLYLAFDPRKDKSEIN
jgi:hypothetical protein